MKIGALKHGQFGRGGDRVDMHPLVFWHAQFAGFGGTGDDYRGRLVHLIARYRHPGVGFGDDAVAFGDRRKLLSAALNRSRRVRVCRRDLREGGEEFTDFQTVVLDA